MILSGLAWIIYRRAHLAGAITPSEEDAYQWHKDHGVPPDSYVRFSPLVYSIENSLPLVKLGEADRWQPDPRQIRIAYEPLQIRLKRNALLIISRARWRRMFSWLLHLTASPAYSWWFLQRVTLSPIFLQRFLWFQIIIGWILATLFAAGITGIIRKD